MSRQDSTYCVEALVHVCENAVPLRAKHAMPRPPTFSSAVTWQAVIIVILDSGTEDLGESRFAGRGGSSGLFSFYFPSLVETLPELLYKCCISVGCLECFGLSVCDGAGGGALCAGSVTTGPRPGLAAASLKLLRQSERV